MANTGKTATRKVSKSEQVISRIANAKTTIAHFDHGLDIIGLTYGHFSMLDLIIATLDHTGPADVTISTWTAGFFDVRAIETLKDSGEILSVRFIIDQMAKAGQADIGHIGRVFGPESVRAIKTHTKFVTVVNDEWNVAISGSMNLNLNRRMEQFQISDDPVWAGFFNQYADEIFAETPEGPNDSQLMPQLLGMDQVQQDLGYGVGRIRELGKPKLGRLSV